MRCSAQELLIAGIRAEPVRLRPPQPVELRGRRGSHEKAPRARPEQSRGRVSWGMSTLRRLLAAAATLGAAGFAQRLFFADPNDDVPLAAWAWIAALVGAALLALRPRLGAQLLARGVLWANLVLGTLVCFIVSWPSSTHALGLVVACAAALLGLGTLGLEPRAEGQRFAPVALRGTLVAILVMAVADTLSLLLWGGAAVEEGEVAAGVPLLLAAAVMAAALFGLYRLRTWGFLLNLLANLAIAALAWSLPALPEPLRYCLSATALGQLLCGLPVLRALIIGGVAPAPMNARRMAVLGAVLIVLLVVAATGAQFSWPRGIGMG